MNKSNNYERVTDKDKIDELIAMIGPVVCKPNHFSSPWLQQKQWIVTPVADTINPMDAEWITTASSALGVTIGYGISLDSDMDVEIYKVPLNQDALLDFSADVSLLNFVLVPSDLSFAILLEAGNYILIAGNKQFVRTAIGCSFSTATTMFLDYATDSIWPEPTAKLLKEVAEKYIL